MDSLALGRGSRAPSRQEDRQPLSPEGCAGFTVPSSASAWVMLPRKGLTESPQSFRPASGLLV